MGECCKTGFAWDGTAIGKETKLGANDAYVVGDNAERAILFVTDIYGWKLPNARLLADHFARETKSTVYIPDYFDGEVLTPGAQFDLMAFIGRNPKDKRYPEIEANAKELKSKYRHVSAVAYCWGAWAVFRLAAKGNGILSCAAAAHPSLVEKSEIDALGAPTLIMAPESDQMFDPLKEYANTKIPTLGIDYRYDFYPGVAHGFAAKGDPKDPVQKNALERAKRSAVQWFVEYSH